VVTKAEPPRRGIDEVWRDHWSLLLYLEDRALNNRGTVDRRCLRCCPARHPTQENGILWWPSSGTRMPDGSRPDPEHDDWDCAEDLLGLGLLERGGPGSQAVFHLTGTGWAVAAALRRARSETDGNVGAQHAAALRAYGESARGRKEER
jgi:hypothetical protein